MTVTKGGDRVRWRQRRQTNNKEKMKTKKLVRIAVLGSRNRFQTYNSWNRSRTPLSFKYVLASALGSGKAGALIIVLITLLVDKNSIWHPPQKIDQGSPKIQITTVKYIKGDTVW